MANSFTALCLLLFSTCVASNNPAAEDSLQKPSKILLMLPLCSKSHKTAFMQIAQELSANRGHHVTVLSPFEPSKDVKNIEEIVVPYKAIEDPTAQSMLFHSTGMNPVLIFPILKPFLIEGCTELLQNEKIQHLINAGKKFDLVIIDGILHECVMPISDVLGNQIVMFSTTVLVPWTYISVPQTYSYVPNLSLPLSDKMSFWQRLENAITNYLTKLLFNYYILPDLQSVVTKYVPQAASIDETIQKIAFVLVNSDPVNHASQPSMPNIVNVGGMHCKDPKPLPKEFEEFIQSSGDDGFIIFSLGSIAQARYLPPEKKSSIIDALSRLKQKVIWKYEEELKNLPTNIKISKWLPQQDLLGHPKCRLFVTHGGLLSLEESIYHGVPLIGIPIFAEQPGNVARLKDLGIGEQLMLSELTAEVLYEKINKLLTDKSYVGNMKKYTSIFREEFSHQRRPEQTAAFWIEYVIRNNGAKHFTSPEENLNFFQYFMLDIFALITLSVVLVVLLVRNVSKLFVRKLRHNTNK